MSSIEFPTREPDSVSPDGVKVWFYGTTTYHEYGDGRRFLRVKVGKNTHITDLQTGNTTIDKGK
jgi:hypothetical protein